MGMSWLKKFGQVAVAVSKQLPVVGPVAAVLIPGNADDKIIAQATTIVDPIVKAITDVESIGAALNLPGDQKLTAATTLIAQATLPYVQKFGVHDPALMQKGLTEIAQGWTDFLNSLKEPTT